jgi:hypothetical protein
MTVLNAGSIAAVAIEIRMLHPPTYSYIEMSTTKIKQKD